jgi:hypothetical protein
MKDAMMTKYQKTFTALLSFLIFVCVRTEVSAREMHAELRPATAVELQTALKNSICADEIVLPANAAINTSTPIMVPTKACTANPVWVHTAGLSTLVPLGTRVSQTDEASLARIVTTSSLPALEFEANASGYRFTGIVFTNIGGNVSTPEIVKLGMRSSGTTLIPYAQKPSYIWFDRCWVREATNDTTTPLSPETTADRGMDINGAHIKITDTRIAGFRGFYKGTTNIVSSNGILFPQSPYDVLIDNCYVEAWFVPIFFGGSGGETSNTATLSNVSFNATTKTGTATFSNVQNLAVNDLPAFKVTGGMYAGGPVSHQVARVTKITGNVVDFVGQSSSQSGTINGGNPLLVTPDVPGQALWKGYLPTDITIRRSRIELKFEPTEYVWTHTKSDPAQAEFGSPTTLPTAQQKFYGNAPKGSVEVKIGIRLTFDGNTFGGWGGGFTITTRNQGDSIANGLYPWSTIDDFVFTNNYVIKGVNWMRVWGGGMGLQGEDNEFTSMQGKNWLIGNNLFADGTFDFLKMGSITNVTVRHNTYPTTQILNSSDLLFIYGTITNGIFEDNIWKNNEYGVNCQTGALPCWPGHSMSNNVIIDNRSSAGKSGDGPLATKYPNDMIADSEAAVGFNDPANGDYGLSKDSPYKGKGHNGTDPGVDMIALRAAQSQTAPSPTPTPVSSPSPSPSPSPPVQPESPNNTRLPPAGRIVDDTGGVWTIRVSDGMVLRDDQPTHGIGSLLLWCDRKIYVVGLNKNWWRYEGNFTWADTGALDPCAIEPSPTPTPTPSPTPVSTPTPIQVQVEIRKLSRDLTMQAAQIKTAQAEGLKLLGCTEDSQTRSVVCYFEKKQ